MKNILLIEPDKEQSELFAKWLKEVGYGVSLAHDPEEAYSLLSEEKCEITIIDIDSPKKTGALLELSRRLKKEPRFSDLPVIVLTYKKDGGKIANALEAGVDNFVLKPFETESFVARMTTIFKEIELKKRGKKVLDLSYINYLIKILSDVNREDFFLVAPIIFNRLIVHKIQGVIGEPIIRLILKQLEESVGRDYGFMKEARVQNGRLIMKGVDDASKDVPVKTLAIAFRDYIFAFLHLLGTLTSNILMERGAL